jgi:formylglycine-generating enzyme required for sulfatase activity
MERVPLQNGASSEVGAGTAQGASRKAWWRARLAFAVPLIAGLLVLGWLVQQWWAKRPVYRRPAGPAIVVIDGIKTPSGYWPIRASGTDAKSGWAREIIHQRTGIELVLIPAGSFRMGSPKDEEGADGNEWPQFPMGVERPFYMGKYEVTGGQWERLMGAHSSHDDLPACAVTWTQCQEFLKAAGAGLRLPTEAEWEYACRAGTTTRYYLGNREEDLGDCAWYKANSGGDVQPVGMKKPNAWGLFDMLGNAEEWCETHYDAYPWVDPLNPGFAPRPVAERGGRVIRGGGWIRPADRCRAAARRWLPEDQDSGLTGLRVACEPQEQRGK